MSAGDIAWVAAGALVGGFVNGLSGFGMAMAAIVFWLQAVSPATASSLAATCAVIAHLQSLPVIIHAINPRRLAPFVIAGLVGIPVGTWLLLVIDEGAFRIWVGALMVLYAAVMLSLRVRLNIRTGPAADVAIGFGGGILGGLAALSGALPAVWAGLRGWGKEERRAILQPYNMSILAVAIVAHLAAGLFTPELLHALLFAVPGTLIGAELGKRLYHRLGDHHFDRVVLAILLAGGATLLASSLLGHH
jgi:uncharacterized membrane protein YfcA